MTDHPPPPAPAAGRSLMRATERNLAAHAAHLHPLVAGTSVFRVGDFQVSDSGLDHDTYNIISRVDFDRGFRREDVAAISEYVRRSGRPFSWWVADDAVLEKARDALVPAGFAVGETEEVMHADLSAPRRRSRAPDGVDIRAAERREHLDDYAQILAANWNPPAADVARFLHRAGAHPGWSNSPTSRFFVAYAEGHAVAGAEVHIAAGVAGLYGIATLDAHRGRGIASALVSACLDWADSTGAGAAVLQATEDGSGVYRRHGFSSFGRCTEFGI